MPNHVHNTVRISGPEKDINELIELVKGEEGAFDFNRIIPSPEELRDVIVGGCTINGDSARIWWRRDNENVAIPDETAARWLKEYGADNWYDWNIHHWGTKWNAYNVEVERESRTAVVYVFYTAWATPQPVMETLSRTFPNICIEVACDGEVDYPFSYRLKGNHSEQILRG